MNILFASSEAHPLVKTGGLADVSGSLPRAIKNMKQEIRLILPAYPAARTNAGVLRLVSEISLTRYASCRDGCRTPAYNCTWSMRPTTSIVTVARTAHRQVRTGRITQHVSPCLHVPYAR